MIGRYVFSTVGGLVLLGILLRVTVFSTFVMEGHAMSPRILPGDHLVATKGDLARVPRGAVVTLPCPGRPASSVCIGRVAGVAGDHLDWREGVLLINDRPDEPELSPRGELEFPSVVPPEHVFLRVEVGSSSEDSRTWGMVPTDALATRVRVVWLSLDWYDAGGAIASWPRVRWSRLFTSVD